MKKREQNPDPGTEYFEIKDSCRKGLLKYLEKAVSIIPIIENPQILDAGCGTGVPALYLAEKLNGAITAVDTDPNSIAILRKKATEMKLSDRIKIFNGSLFDFKTDNNLFDIVLAEGLLNVVGFRKGISSILALVKRGGFIILHDETGLEDAKMRFIEKGGCRIVATFVLDEHTWWNDYYKCLEEKILSRPGSGYQKVFKAELSEIESFKRDSSLFHSMYYILQRN